MEERFRWKVMACHSLNVTRIYCSMHSSLESYLRNVWVQLMTYRNFINFEPLWGMVWGWDLWSSTAPVAVSGFALIFFSPSFHIKHKAVKFSLFSANTKKKKLHLFAMLGDYYWRNSSHLQARSVMNFQRKSSQGIKKMFTKA